MTTAATRLLAAPTASSEAPVLEQLRQALLARHGSLDQAFRHLEQHGELSQTRLREALRGVLSKVEVEQALGDKRASDTSPDEQRAPQAQLPR